MINSSRRIGSAYYSAVKQGITNFSEITSVGKLPHQFVVIDLETTGLDYNKDRITEIALIKYQDGVPIDYYSTLVDPETRVLAKITQITGITDKMLKGKPKIYDIIEDIHKRINGQIIVGYNVPFDLNFISIALGRSKINIDGLEYIDVMNVVSSVLSREEVFNLKLETIKKHFGIDTNSHRALDDCITTFTVLEKCLELRKNKYFK